MTRFGFALAVCAGLMLLLASPAARAGDPVAGKKLFVANCAACHGIEGTAVLLYAPSFARGETLDKHDAALIVSVRDGIYRMPPLGGYLTESQIADAIAYARTLRKSGNAAGR